jgi:hypothetical protein
VALSNAKSAFQVTRLLASQKVVEREKAVLRRERHGHRELRGVKKVITALFALEGHSS